MIHLLKSSHILTGAWSVVITLVTPLHRIYWVQDPRRALAIHTDHDPNFIGSQPEHLGPIPQCPRMSNLATIHFTLRKFQETTLQKITYCYFKLLNRTSCVQESLPHVYISSYSSTALQKWPYASNTSHHHTDSYQYTVETTWRTSKTQRTYIRWKEKLIPAQWILSGQLAWTESTVTTTSTPPSKSQVLPRAD